MVSTCSSVTITTEGVIGHVVLSRPDKRNAINQEMIAAIGAVFADPPPAWRAVVLSAEGPHFSAGLDLSEHRQRTAAEVMSISRLWHRATQSILGGNIPVVAALHGAVIGAGLELAASAHIRIAASDIAISLPEARRGIFVGGGASVRVGRLIGTSRLMEMMLTGRTVNAAESAAIGLVHHVVDPDACFAVGCTTADTIAENAPLSNQMIIGALNEIADMPQGAGLFTESLAVALTQTDGEAERRMSGFLDRKPGS